MQIGFGNCRQNSSKGEQVRPSFAQFKGQRNQDHHHNLIFAEVHRGYHHCRSDITLPSAQSLYPVIHLPQFAQQVAACRGQNHQKQAGQNHGQDTL